MDNVKESIFEALDVYFQGSHDVSESLTNWYDWVFDEVYFTGSRLIFTDREDFLRAKELLGDHKEWDIIKLSEYGIEVYFVDCKGLEILEELNKEV